MNIRIINQGKDISRVIINDPKTYNSLSTRNLIDLIKVFKKLNNDKNIKVIILEGAGKGFSAGHNLKEVRGLKKKEKYQKLFNLCSKLMLQIVEGRKPVIAKVHGAAYAAGCQLAASCDLAYSTNETQHLQLLELILDYFVVLQWLLLVEKINRKRTMRMLLTGDPISAKYAKEIGLINDHFSQNPKLNKEVFKVAKKISSKSKFNNQNWKKSFL